MDVRHACHRRMHDSLRGAGEKAAQPAGPSVGKVRRRKDGHHPVQSSFHARTEDIRRTCAVKRHQEARDLHFITFSCYPRQPLLANPSAMYQFEVALELSRVLYDFYVTGYVVMPEHVHLLISEPQRGTVASAVT